MRALIPAILAACLATPAAPAQIDRPDGSGRLISSWDFEDRKLRPEPIPMHWFRSLHDPARGSHRPGFPRYNLAELDDTHAVSGRWAIKLPTKGGSTALVLARGVAPIIPGSDLLMTTWVRTDGLQHARARVVARLLDDRLDPIAGGESRSDPILSEREWAFARVEVPSHEDAAWIQIELQLLQPQQLDTGPPKLGEVQPMDVRGAAWFDDVRLYQAPRIILGTLAESNLSVAPDRPTVRLRVRDLTGEALTADVTAYAWDGTIADETTIAISPDGTPHDWTPRLDAFGWYRTVARISSTEGAVAQTFCDLAWLAPPHRAAAPDRAFGVAIRHEPEEDLQALPALVERLGAGHVWLDVWQRAERMMRGVGTSAPAARRALGALESVAERWLENGVDLTFVLERAPERLAAGAQLEVEDTIGILASDPDLWLDELRPMLNRFGERVRRWQLGPVEASATPVDPALAEQTAAIRESLYRLIPRPIIVLPWPAYAPASLIPAGDAAFTLWSPVGVPASAAPELVAAFEGAGPPAVILEPIDAETYGVGAKVRSLAIRAVRAWAAGADTVAIEAPWAWRAHRDLRCEPTPMYPVWRTLVETLAGRTLVGEMPVADGAVALLVGDPASGGSGAIIAWNETAPPRLAAIEGYLGAGPIIQRDLFGNDTVLPDLGEGVRHADLSPTPIIIEGVDLDLLNFRAALRIEPPFIETKAQQHDVELVIRNPWSTAIGGRLRFASPEEWQIKPRVLDVSVPPGGEQRAPISLTFPLNEVAGPREMVAEIQIAAERRYPTIRLPIPVELGLEDLEVSPTYRFVDGDGGPGSDLVLTVLVTNTGDEEISLDAETLAPGRAGQEATVHALGPGQTTLRRFRFNDARRDLMNQRIRLSMREREGAGRFNRWIEIR